MIVSHFNACNSKGMSWVDEVLVAGLRKGDKMCDWKIEVHSSDDDDEESPQDGDSTEQNEKDVGPAVYIVRKVALTGDSSNDISKVSLKFFGY